MNLMLANTGLGVDICRRKDNMWLVQCWEFSQAYCLDDILMTEFWSSFCQIQQLCKALKLSPPRSPSLLFCHSWKQGTRLKTGQNTISFNALSNDVYLDLPGPRNATKSIGRFQVGQLEGRWPMGSVDFEDSDFSLLIFQKKRSSTAFLESYSFWVLDHIQ